MTTRHYSQTAKVYTWGSQANARRVTHLTPDERAAVRAGSPVYLADCPEHNGTTDRRVIARGRHFYARMP